MAFSTLFGILILPALACAKSTSMVPSFFWDQESSHHGVPLLRIQFPDGGADDFAVLRPYNPIPRGPLEREEEMDSCIFEGFLLNERASVVTVTGCPNSRKFEVQLQSKRLRSTMFVVEDGQARQVRVSPNDRHCDYLEADGDEVLRSPVSANRQVSPTGYILKIKIYYDDNWKEVFAADSLNTVRRVVAHAQNVWKWSTAPAKIYLVADTEVKYIPGKWAASKSLSLVSKNNIDSVDLNVYLTMRGDNSNDAIGMAYLAGICQSLNIKSCIVEWDTSDILAARTLAHEIGHNVGISHDFKGRDAAITPRFDSTGKPCTNVGGIMDRAASKENEKSLWSSCSVEDFTNTMKSYPECLTPASSANLPPTDTPALTDSECKMPSSLANLNGVHSLKLNGVKSKVACISGICFPLLEPGDMTKACTAICGKESCIDAVALSYY